MTGKKLKSKISLMLIIMIAVSFLMKESVLAKTPQFRLDIDSLNLQKGVSTNVVFSLTNAKGAEVVEIDGLENFDVISKSNAVSTQIINGDRTYEENFNYAIMPKETGQFTLQGSVKYKGKIYETNKLEVNVGKAENIKKGEAEDLFVKTVLSQDEIYFGQKVVLTYELYSRYNIENFGFIDSVEINDFISSSIPKDKLNANYTYIDGNKYVKYEAKKMFLSPVKTGIFTIPAYNFQVNISTGDFFDSSRPVYIQTDSKELSVKSLPQEDKPANFSGIVGNLNLQADYNKQKVNYGDSITLHVTAFGSCNLDDLKKIVKDDIPGFSVYETEKNLEESIENNQYKAKKEFEVILVPQKTGDINIEPTYISYFNPESGNYEQAGIPGITITVSGETPQAQTGTVNKGTEKVERVKIEQVNYEPMNEGYLTIQIKKQHLLIGLVIIIILIIAVILFLLINSRRKIQDKELEEIYKKIKNTDNENELYNLFNTMMKHCFNISLKARSRNDILNRLEGNKIAVPVLEVMDYMENKKYSSNKSEMNLKDKIKEIYKLQME